MTTDLHTIFSDSGCPSSDDLRSYLDNRLTDEEKHRIEAHLADCELCSDELEGLSLLSDPDQLPAIVEELDQRIAARRFRILRLRPRLILAAAAALAVLLISVIFIFRFVVLPHQESLLSEQPYAPVKPADSTLPLSPKEVAPALSSEQKVIQQKALPDKVRKVEEKSAGASDIPVIIAPDVAESLDMASSSMSKVDEIAGISEDTALAEASPIGGVSYTRKSMGREPNMGDSTATKMKLAKDLFSAQNYPEAARLFQDLVRQEPANYTALYHLALCYSEMTQPKKALKALERVLEDPDSLYYQQAIQLKVKISTNEPR